MKKTTVLKKETVMHSEDNTALENNTSNPNRWERMLSWFKEHSYLGISGLISGVAVLIIYMVVTGGLFPIGKGSVLVLDLNAQYIYFFSALRKAIFGEAELLYSFSRSLGGEFLGIYAYYLASPLSYLVCLFPADKMQEFATLLLILKTALCGMTMGYYLHKHSKNLNKLSIVAFSLLYSLCAYCIVYQTNLMWMDAVIWLPLLTLGLESLIKYGKYKLFIVSLALTVASNYYIGYMCCIFVAVYFLYYMIAHKNTDESNPLLEKSHFKKTLLRLIIFSVIAICIAAIVIFSAYYSLSFGKTEFSDTSFEIAPRVEFFDIIFKFFPGTYDSIDNMNAKYANPEENKPATPSTGAFPFVYCGIITLLLVPAFFCSKKFSRREKIASALFIGFFILSFMISTLDLIWHGFQYPNCLQNRYSFMLCFFLVALAFRTFEIIDEPNIKWGIITSAVFWSSFAIIIQKFSAELTEGIRKINDKFELGTFEFAFFAVFMIVMYLIIMAMSRNASNKTIISAALLIVISVELILNGISNVNAFGDDFGFSNYPRYNDYQKLMYPIVDTVRDSDESFYRMEKTLYRQPNDNMQFGIRGIANSTSTLNASTIQFIQTMGYSARAQWSLYLGGNPVNDSLLGIKYIITDRDFSEFYGEPAFTIEEYAEYMGVSVDELIEQTHADKTDTGKYKGKSAADYVVYENPYALSLGFAASKAVIDFNMKMYCTYNQSENEYNDGGYTNPFERLNALYTAILGESETVEIFKPAKQNNVTYTDNVKYTYGARNEKTDDSVITHHKYTGSNGKITYDYTVPKDTTLYLYLPAYLTRKVDISASVPIVDGTTNFNGTSYGNPTSRIVELGKSDKENYQLYVKITGGEFFVYEQESYIYYVDTELLAEVTAKIKENQLVIKEFTDSNFEGTIKTNKDKQLILTTIPYDKGWEVKVDGKKVDTIDAVDTTPGRDGGGALLAFEIDSAGKHTITMEYKPGFIPVGLVISGASLLIFIALIIFEKKLLMFAPCRKILQIEDNRPKAVETKNKKNKAATDTTNKRKEK